MVTMQQAMLGLGVMGMGTGCLFNPDSMDSLVGDSVNPAANQTSVAMAAASDDAYVAADSESLSASLLNMVRVPVDVIKTNPGKTGLAGLGLVVTAGLGVRTMVRRRRQESYEQAVTEATKTLLQECAQKQNLRDVANVLARELQGTDAVQQHAAIEAMNDIVNSSFKVSGRSFYSFDLDQQESFYALLVEPLRSVLTNAHVDSNVMLAAIGVAFWAEYFPHFMSELGSIADKANSSLKSQMILFLGLRALNIGHIQDISALKELVLILANKCDRYQLQRVGKIMIPLHSAELGDENTAKVLQRYVDAFPDRAVAAYAEWENHRLGFHESVAENPHMPVEARKKCMIDVCVDLESKDKKLSWLNQFLTDADPAIQAEAQRLIGVIESR